MTAQKIENGEPRVSGAGRAVGMALRVRAWEQRVTQAQLAAHLGVNQSTVGKKLRGDLPMTIDELMGMAEALGIEDPGQLLPRLDSNQQPSGYLSSLVNRQVFVFGWGGLADYAGTVTEVDENLDGELVVLVRSALEVDDSIGGHYWTWLQLVPELLVPLQPAMAGI